MRKAKILDQIKVAGRWHEVLVESFDKTEEQMEYTYREGNDFKDVFHRDIEEFKYKMVTPEKDSLLDILSKVRYP